MNGCSFSESADVVLDNTGISFDFLHGFDVQLKVRSMAVPVWMHVSLLTQDDLIDKPSSAPGDRWQPNRVNTGQIPLKCLEEKHEVPNGKDMCLHKDLNLRLMVDSLIDLMTV